jgi:hypothetical protein
VADAIMGGFRVAVKRHDSQAGIARQGRDQAWLPISEVARRSGQAVIDDMPLFPSPVRGSDDDVPPWTRWHARDLLERAEMMAKLEHQEGGDFHPYRRAWASARKGMPLIDVVAAGGWRDLRSLENCYTLPDSKTILSVVTTASKIRDAQSATA